MANGFRNLGQELGGAAGPIRPMRQLDRRPQTEAQRLLEEEAKAATPVAKRGEQQHLQQPQPPAAREPAGWLGRGEEQSPPASPRLAGEREREREPAGWAEERSNLLQLAGWADSERRSNPPPAASPRLAKREGAWLAGQTLRPPRRGDDLLHPRRASPRQRAGQRVTRLSERVS